MATTGKTPRRPTASQAAAKDAAATRDSTLLASNLDLSKISRIGNERIVKVDGINGIFTPIGSADESPVGADERKNLLNIIDQLKRELAKLRSENLALQSRIDTLVQRPSAPDDFASAVQQSVDELQQRMASMHNSMSNFAVRQLKLDASVFVQVSPLGSIEYRFIQPGDNIEAAAVSRLAMEIVPVPRNDLAGVWSSSLFQPELPIAALASITSEQVKALEGAGIYSIGEFLQLGTRVRAQAYLEALLGTQRQQLSQWAQQAALMTLRGVNGAAAITLIDAGFGSFDALAAATPATIVAAYAEKRAGNPQIGAPEIEETLAALWVRAVRQYLGLAEAPATD